jgi:hypothetical protein
MPTALIAALTTEELAVMTSDQIRGINSAGLNALTTDEVQSITIAGVKGLTFANLQAMSTDRLTAFTNAQTESIQAVLALSTDQLAQLTGF